MAANTFRGPTAPVDERAGDRDISRGEQWTQAREVGNVQARQLGDSHEANEVMPRSILTLSHGIVNEFTTFLPYLTNTPTAVQPKPSSTALPPITRSSSSPEATATSGLLAGPTSSGDAAASQAKGEMPTPKAHQQNNMGALSQNNLNRGAAIGIAAGIFSAFAAVVLAGVLLYKYRRRKRSELNLKPYQ